tara:strand:- start:539 stop:787 length:249 start_codon:yes stop_codon:yes gene_type:complete
MLKSLGSSRQKTYVGFTNNVKLRLSKHNTNKGAKATRGYKWVVIYRRSFKEKNIAMSYEYRLKKNRIKRANILKDYLDEQRN